MFAHLNGLYRHDRRMHDAGPCCEQDETIGARIASSENHEHAKRRLHESGVPCGREIALRFLIRP